MSVLTGNFIFRATPDRRDTFMSRKSNNVDTSPLTLIVEPNPSGHHLSWVGRLVDSCRSQGRPVVVLTTAIAVESNEWSVHLAAKAPEVVLYPPSAFALSDIAQAAADAGASRTILADGDHYLLPILRRGWSGSGKLSILVIRPGG